MSDTDRLAALLHAEFWANSSHDLDNPECDICHGTAARLVAQGVTVRGDEGDCVCGARDHRGECHFGWHKDGCPDAPKLNMDDYMAGYRQAQADAQGVRVGDEGLRAAALADAIDDALLYLWPKHMEGTGSIPASDSDRHWMVLDPSIPQKGLGAAILDTPGVRAALAASPAPTLDDWDPRKPGLG